jgi:RNA polymerase sigma factor (sigma-70 family)
MTDEELAGRLATGDQSAADELFRRHKTLVENVIYRVSKGVGPSDELVQETFTKAFLKVQQFNPDLGEFKAWLGTIARNVTLTYLRNHPAKDRDAESVNVETLVDDTDLGTAAVGSLRKLASVLKKEIEKLKSPDREILQKRIIDQKPFDLIARAVQLPVNTVKTIYYRQSKAIQKRLLPLRRPSAD